MLLEYLEFSEKTSMISLIYDSKASLMRAQAILIEIGEHMLEFCQQVDQFLRERYYKILVAVLDRGELDLGQMEINSDDQYDAKLFANKKTLAAAFQRFIYRTLVHATKRINAKGIEAYV